MLSRLTKKRRFSVRSSRGVGSGPVVISYGFRIRLELSYANGKTHTVYGWDESQMFRYFWHAGKPVPANGGEFTPVETDTSVTCPRDGDRVWSLKQEARVIQTWEDVTAMIYRPVLD
jgi:hypothetical protein